MIGFHSKDGILYADKKPVSEIVQSFPTPFYLYSASKITERYQALDNALQSTWTGTKKPLIAFACKANSNLAVMNLLGSLGAGMDVVSGGELQRALKAGVPAGRIVFSGVGKTDAELELALNQNIHQINVESGPELKALQAVAVKLNKKVAIALRFTPDVDSKAHAKTSTGEKDHKFGLLREEILDLADSIKGDKHITLKAVSMHIGSGVPELDPFKDAFVRTRDLIQELQAKGHPVDTADLGGGIWIPYRDEPQADLRLYGQIINEIFASMDLQIMLEPGRIMVAEAGALISSVIFIKDRPSKKFAIIDAAMNDLIRPTLYDAHHPIQALTPRKGAAVVYDVVGPVCETGDYLALDRSLTPLERGDKIAVLCAGAYGSVMSSPYNTRPFIAEIMVNGDQVAVVRAEQTLEDQWKDEKLPSWK